MRKTLLSGLLLFGAAIAPPSFAESPAPAAVSTDVADAIAKMYPTLVRIHVVME